jgi:hypothetical protein
MNVVQLAFRNQNMTEVAAQEKSGGLWDKPAKILLLAAAGLPLGMALGTALRQLVKAVMAMELFTRYAIAGGAAFLAVGAWFLLSFSRGERRHELLLAGYEEKQRFYYGLLDSVFAALEGFHQGGKNPAEEMLAYLQAYRTEFYTYAGGKVIEAVDAWFRAADALADPAGGLEGGDFSLLHKVGKRIIRAVKEDLCQQGVEYADEVIFPLLAPPAAPPSLLRRLK